MKVSGFARQGVAHTAILCSLAVVVSSASAAELRVPADFPTIQAAIDAAVAGDEVVVAAGTYAETIDFLGKAIVVQSEDGAADTVIDGGGADVWVVSAVSGEGPDSVLRGFTVTGGVAASYQTGGGILVDGSALTVEDSVIQANTGDGILVNEGDLVVVGSRISSNDGHGIEGYFGNLTVENSDIIGNEDAYGGGISAAAGSLTVLNSTFTDNIASTFGAAIYSNHAVLSISGITATNNGDAEEQEGGGTVFFTSGGGGIYASGGSGLISNSLFEGNRAFAGGGIYIRDTSEITVANCVITASLGGIGSAVYCNSSSPTIVNSTVVDNGTAGGLYTTFNAFPVVRNSIFSGNGSLGLEGVEFYGNGIVDLAYSVVNTEIAPFTPGIGDGVLEIDPQIGENFRPLAGSPAIDAGNNAEVPEGIETDFAGDPRFVDDPDTEDTGVGTPPIVDIGAFEFQIPAPSFTTGDINCDGSIDGFDIDAFVIALSDPAGYGDAYPDCVHMSADINGDGIVDGFDIDPFVLMMTD